MKLETFADLDQVPGIDLVEDSPTLTVLEELIAQQPQLDGDSLLRAAATLYQIPAHAKIGAVHKVLKALPLGHLIRLWRLRNPALRGGLEVAMKEAMPLIASSLAARIERSRPSTIPLPEPVLQMRVGVMRRRLARFWPEYYRELGLELSYAHDDATVGAWLSMRPPRGPSTATRTVLERLGARLFERQGKRTDADDQRLLSACKDPGLVYLLEQQLASPRPPEALRDTGLLKLDRLRRTVTYESPQFDGCLAEVCESVTLSFANPQRPSFSCPNGSNVPCALKRFAATRIAEVLSEAGTPLKAEFVEGLKELVRADGADILLSRLSLAGAGTPEKPEGASVGWLFTPPDKLEAVWLTEKKKGGLKAKKIPKNQVRAALTRPAHHATLTLLEAKYALRSMRYSTQNQIGPALATLANDPTLYLGPDVVPLKIVVDEPRLAPKLDGRAMKFEIAIGSLRLDAEHIEAGLWLSGLVEGPTGPTLYVGVVGEALSDATALLHGLEQVEVAPASQAKVAEGLLALSNKVPLVAHGSWLGERHHLEHHWVLKLEMIGGRGARRVLASLGVRIVEELGVLDPCGGPETLPLKTQAPDGTTTVGHVVRDFGRELDEALDLAERLALSEQKAFVAVSIDDLDRALEVIARAQALASEGVLEIAWASRPIAVKTAKNPGALKLQIGHKRDWLDLKGGYHLDGAELPLKELLDALRHNKRFVEVDDQTLVELDEELKRSLMPLLSLAREKSGKVVASPLSAPLVNELERSGVEVDAPPEWLALTDKLDEAVALMPALPHIDAELRPYQVEGYAWAMRLAHWAMGACLADDMGLGKTLQALTVISARADEGPTLVVAPTSVVPNWVREARRFTPHLRVLRVLQGTQLDEALLAVGPGVILVTSWDLLVRHEARVSMAPGDEGPKPWRTLVLDEAQAMKNPTTKRAQVARAVSRDFALVLTGTPVENRPLELWSLMSVVAPGLLGSAEDFKENFGRPIEERQEGAARSLARIVRPFILRRTKGEVARDLPNKTEIRVDVVLTTEEQERYARIRNSAIKTMLEETSDGPPAHKLIRMLAVLTRLRQLACHPRLVDNKAPHTSSKLERLVELAEELAGEGRKMLVFSQFTELLSLVREAFDAAKLSYTYLDGSTPGMEREKAVARFQRGEVDAFLLSLKAGGVGLNLTAASEVIHLDPWWNPAVEDQASDRAHRIGQDKPVTVYRMVALGTIEEQILTLHADKRMMMASLLEGTDSAAPISSDEMLSLLMAGGDEASAEAAPSPTSTSTATPRPTPSAPTLSVSRPADAPISSSPTLELVPPFIPAPTLELVPPPTPAPTLELAPRPAAAAVAPPASTPRVPSAPATPEELLARVFDALNAKSEGLSKAELLAATGVPDPLWPDLRRLLQARPELEVTGSTRATRYRLRQPV